MGDPMMWIFAILIVLVMGVIAMLASGRGEPMVRSYDDRPDALVPADRPLGGADLRKVRFSLAVRGYRMSEVDALLRRLAAELDDRDDPLTSFPKPPPEEVPALARAWVDDRAASGDERYDGSPASLAAVDETLGRWGADPAAVPFGSVVGAGAYAGEVLLGQVEEARWGNHRAFGDLPVVLMPHGAVENPIGKAVKRFEGGPEESVAFFVEAAIARWRRDSREAAAPENLDEG